MTGYEAVFNNSLPFVHTIDPTNIHAVQSAYAINNPSLPKQRLGSFGKPQTVKLPDRAARFNVADPIHHSNVWLSRANTLHLLVPKPATAGNISVMVFYCRAGFRTIDNKNLPKVNSNIFVDTDQQWRYVYKVSTAKIYPQNLPYVPSESTMSKMVIVCNDAGNQTNVIVEANLLSVQGIAS